MPERIWRQVPVDSRMLFGLIGSQLEKLDCKYEGILPDFRTSKTLLIGSDYGGEENGAPYCVYSFLVTSIESWAEWEKARLLARDEHLKDSRRMSFKRLSDGQRKRALPHFLKAADSLNGLLISVCVHKQSVPVFEKSPPLDLSNPEFFPFKKWKASALNKAFFVCHMFNLLVAGMARSGQNVLWFTDADIIAANDQRICELSMLSSVISRYYIDFDLGSCKCGTAKCDNGTMQIEDLLAIPDMAAGALSEQLKLRESDDYMCTRMFCMFRGEYTSKTSEITWWLSNARSSLKRLVFFVDPDHDGKANIVSTFHFKDQC